MALSALDLVLMEKQVRGSLFGSSNPRADIPRMVRTKRLDAAMVEFAEPTEAEKPV